MNTYRRNQVGEYLVVLPRQGEIRWYGRRADRYELLVEYEGIVRSRQFPGLWLNVPALLAGDAASMLNTLRAGLDSSGHAEFVIHLQSAVG
jgi:Uma2 family endonuclease